MGQGKLAASLSSCGTESEAQEEFKISVMSGEKVGSPLQKWIGWGIFHSHLKAGKHHGGA